VASQSRRLTIIRDRSVCRLPEAICVISTKGHLAGEAPNSLKNSSFVIRVLYAICLAGAAWNYARILFEHGLWWNYGGIHPFYTTFWTSLTFFDSLAVLLLLIRSRTGLVLTTLIIVNDVLINACVGLADGIDVASFLAQFISMLFVLGTVRRAWTGSASGAFNRRLLSARR